MAGAGPLPRTRLEQLVHQLRRTQAEFQQDFAGMAKQLGERLDVSSRQVTRWLAGNVDVLPRVAACRVLEQMFGESAERLFGPADPVCRREVATVEVSPTGAGQPGAGGGPDCAEGGDDGRRRVSPLRAVR
ncbi:MAG: hypothetical protein ACRDTF_15535 [Pseudonocardiaceae bacterium]